MSGSLALAGLNACTRQPLEKIVPYVEQPELIVPGKPLFFATAMPLGESAVGLLVESREGRPIKVEGNPDHPASLGATSVFHQAALLPNTGGGDMPWLALILAAVLLGAGVLALREARARE